MDQFTLIYPLLSLSMQLTELEWSTEEEQQWASGPMPEEGGSWEEPGILSSAIYQLWELGQLINLFEPHCQPLRNKDTVIDPGKELPSFH